MVRKMVIACVMSLLLSMNLFLPKANAILLNLSEEHIKEAVNYGKKRKQALLGDFVKGWTVNKGNKVGWATLYTGFHNLAYEARKAAIENRELLPKQINKALEMSKTLTFTVSILGGEIDFAPDYHTKLRCNDAFIAPIYEFIPEMAEPSEFWPEEPDYVAGCVFKFPVEKISPDSSITLIVTDIDASSILEFPFDLSKMK